MQKPSTEHDALEQAAEWFAALGAGAGEAEEARWRAWLAADPAHRRAWARVEALEVQFRRLRGEPARQALHGARMSRRRVLGAVAALAVGGPALWAGTRLAPHWQADYRTATGEVRGIRLVDGARVWLNTASALDVHYGPGARRIVLVAGEVLVHTAPDHHEPARPLRLSTRAGGIRPLGTRFSVRERGDEVTVGVHAGAVSLQPAGRQGAPHILEAGRQARMSASGVAAVQPLQRQDPAWAGGVLKADDMALDVFLDELARYRPGHLGYTDDVAGLRLVGAFPLHDTDRILAALEASLPVRVRYVSPWWVRVEHR